MLFPNPCGMPTVIAAAGGLVTDSLEMHLDAGNSSSYSGSGSTWSDLQNSYDFSITGATFNGTAGDESSSEYFSHDGSGDYFDLASAHSGTIMRQLGKTTVPFSLEMWVYTVTGISQYFYASAFSGGSGWGVVKSNTTGSHTDKITSVTPDNASSVNAQAGTHTNSAWHQFVVTGQLDGSTTCTFYEDGAADGTFTDTGFTATDSSYVPRIGARPNGAALSVKSGHRTAIYRVYSKILSAAEVTQNYDHNKGRFGLS